MFFKKFFVGVLLTFGLFADLYATNGIRSLAIADASYISQSGKPDMAFSLLMAKASNIAYQDSLSSYDQDFFEDNGFANLKLNTSSVSGVEFLTATRDVVVNGISKHIVFISFRGTAGVKDLWTDASLKKTKFIDNEEVIVHGGFHGYFKKFRDYENQLKIQNNELLSSIITSKSDDTFYLLTGHSLGGAIAKLYGASLLERGIKPSNILVYTFGAPPVGYDAISVSKTFSKTYQFRTREDGTPYSGLKVVQYRNYYDPIANLHRVYFKDGGYLSHIALALTYSFDETGARSNYDMGCKYPATQAILNVNPLTGLIDSFSNEIAYSLVNNDLPNCDYSMGAHSLSLYIDNLYKNIDFYAIAQKKIANYTGTVELSDEVAKAISAIIERPAYRSAIRDNVFHANNLLTLDRKRLIQEIKSLGVGISADSFGQEGQEIRATIKNMVDGKQVSLDELQAIIGDVQALDGTDYMKLAWGTGLNITTAVSDILTFGSASVATKGVKITNSLGKLGKLGTKLKGPLLQAVKIAESKPFIFVKLFVEQGFTVNDKMTGMIKEDQATASLVNGLTGMQGDLNKAALEVLMQNNKSKFLVYFVGKLNDIVVKIVQGSTTSLITDTAVRQVLDELLVSIGEMVPVAGPIYAQYNLSKKVSEEIDNKPKVINAWNNYFSTSNALINDIKVLGDSWFSVRLDTIVSNALSQYDIYKETKRQELEEIENNKPRLDFTLPENATLDGYSVNAQLGATVSFSPYVTAKNFIECVNQPYSDHKPYYWTDSEMIEMFPEDTDYRLWYYDEMQSNSTRTSLSLVYDREKNSFSFTMPSEKIRLAGFTLNHKDYEKRFIYGCGLPTVWESVDSNGTTESNTTFSYRDNFDSLNQDFWYIVRMYGPSGPYWKNNALDYNSVNLHNGQITLEMDRTDDGPVMYSKALRVNNGDIVTIKRKSYIHPANRYFTGGLNIVSSDNDFSINFDKGLCSISNYDYTYQGDWNTFILQDRTNPENFITPVWNDWVEEELIYNTATGEATYKVGDETVTGTCEVLDKDYIKLRIHSFGWYTGHYTKMDYIDIQIDSITNGTLLTPDKTINLLQENYYDGTISRESFTKEWTFNQDLTDLNITILENSYQNTITSSDLVKDGKTLKVNLTPDTSKAVNKLVLQFKNSNGEIVKVSGSETFWSLTKTNHVPRLADGQITKLVGDSSATLDIGTYDADGDTVTLSVEDSASGSVSLNGNRLSASFSDGQVAHTIKIGLNDGKETVVKSFRVIDFSQNSIENYYADVASSSAYFDAIAFGTLKGVVEGQVNPNNETQRIFRPDDNVSLAEALKIVIKAEKEAGLIELKSRKDYLEAYPNWAMKYYTFARETNALDKEIFNLAEVYPTKQMIARIIVKTLDLDKGLQDSGVVKPEFTDSSDFNNAQMQYYGDIVHTLGLFMTDTEAKPQETISRAELAIVIEKIFMIPSAKISLSQESVVKGEGTVAVSLQEVKAQAINSNYELYDSKSEVRASAMINGSNITTLPLDSSTLEVGQNAVYVVLDNNGVKKILSKTLDVFAADNDGDQVENSLDKWIEDARYAYDENGNGIPDILDAIFSLSDKRSDGNTTINGNVISIEELINNGGYSPDLDGDGISDDLDPDIDGDGTVNIQDAFPYDANESVDTDGDGIGNNADSDDDGDGLSDQDEIDNGLDPMNGNDADADSDGDGISNRDEIKAGTNPNQNDGTIHINPIENIYLIMNTQIAPITIEANASNGSSLTYQVTSSNLDVVVASIDDNLLTLTPVSNAIGDADITVTANLGAKSKSITFEVHIKQSVISLEDGQSGVYEPQEEFSYSTRVDGTQIDVNVADDGTLVHRVTRDGEETYLHVGIAGAEVRLDHEHTATITLPTQHEVYMLMGADGRVTPYVQGALLPKGALPFATQIEADDKKVKFTIPMPARLEF